MDDQLQLPFQTSGFRLQLRLLGLSLEGHILKLANLALQILPIFPSAIQIARVIALNCHELV